MAKMVVTILGCGSSGGVPRVAQGWGKCDPNEPKNRRRRCSILVERVGPDGTTRVLIDTSPDLREQLIDAGVPALDAVVYTHEHADHTHGIDDLRPFAIVSRKRMPVYADSTTMGMLTKIHAVDGAVYWIVSEFPGEMRGMKWMAVEERYKEARAPQELFDTTETVKPYTGDGFLRPATPADCWTGNSHEGVFKVVGIL